MRLSLQWRWFLGFTALLALLLLDVTVWVNVSLPPYLTRQLQNDLLQNAQLLRELFSPLLAAQPLDVAEINRRAHKYSQLINLRVTVLDADGTVVGESARPLDALPTLENHGRRPEVLAAHATGVGVARRVSSTVGVELLYVALPVIVSNGPTVRSIGTVRVAQPLQPVRDTTRHICRAVAISSAALLVLALPVVYWLTRRLTVPIGQMRAMATAVAAGDFSVRAPTGLGGELGELATALNDMSRQLETRLRELAAEKAELNATLAHMIEGVLVVDADGRIRLANDTLRRQFQLTDEAIGKTVLEAMRNAPLQDLISAALQSEETTTRELSFFTPEEHTYSVSVARLQGPAGQPLGAVLVFHDVTRIKQLEAMRKEFVANVSHELRTPVSIIKGYVETLLDEHPPDPTQARQFLETIQRHTRRLEALIADLLTISALESHQARLNLEPTSLRAAVEEVVTELAPQAAAKNIVLTVAVAADLPPVRADRLRLQQVLFNLLDNALKYTQPGGHVTVSASVRDGTVECCVRDDGPGIEPQHLPHVFQRFYRADKARSRELGGTGLGLAIVKHIVQAHGGQVWAESPPLNPPADRGSAFYFTLPVA